MDKFAAWINENEGSSSVIIKEGKFGRGVFLNDALRQELEKNPQDMTGNIIASISKKLVINRNYVLGCHPIGQLFSSQTEVSLDEREAIILFLLYERFVAPPDSFWRPYIDVLPRTFTTAIFFTEKEKQAIGHDQIEMAIDSKLKNLKKEHETLQKTGILDNELVLTFDNYLWSDAAFVSRVFSEARVLVPFLDFANHSNSPTASFEVDKESESVNLVVNARSEDILKSDGEIFIQYGEKGNEELMFQYGFALEENPHNKAMALVPLSPDDPLLQFKYSIIQNYGIGPRMTITSEGFDAKAFLQARICVMDEEDASKIDEIIAKYSLEGDERSAVVSDVNELRALSMLVWIVEDQLETIVERTGDVQDDVKLLESGLTGENHNLRTAVIYRLGQKKLLAAAKEKISNEQSKFVEQDRIKDLIRRLEESKVEETN